MILHSFFFASRHITYIHTGVDHRDTGYEELALADGLIEITIDGQRLRKGVVFGVEIDKDVVVTLTKPIPFRGIMARIDGGSANVDTSMVFDFVEGETVLKRNQSCELDVSMHGRVTDAKSNSRFLSFD